MQIQLLRYKDVHDLNGHQYVYGVVQFGVHAFNCLEPYPCKLEYGVHHCILAYSKKFKKQKVFIESLHHVGIMFHEGNTVLDSAGCVLLGHRCDGGLSSSKENIKEFESLIIPVLLRGESVSLNVQNYMFDD